MIAAMAGRGVQCLEMFARFDAENPVPEGWDLWGNEATASPQGAHVVGREIIKFADDGVMPSVVDQPAPPAEGSAPEDGIVNCEASASGARPSSSSDAFDAAAVPPADRPGSELRSALDDERRINDENRGAAWKALGAIDAGMTIEGPILESLRGLKYITGKNPRLTKRGQSYLVELDEHFQRLAKLAELPTSVDDLVELYRQALARFDVCVRAGDVFAVEAEEELLDLLQIRANGGTNFGMARDGSPAERLRAESAAPTGEIPGWRQRGVFRLVVDGIPHLVGQDEDGSLDVYAEDPDKPFVSESGYRWICGNGVALGCTVAEQAEAYSDARVPSQKAVKTYVDGHTGGALQAANNLSDVASAASSRANLGVGAMMFELFELAIGVQATVLQLMILGAPAAVPRDELGHLGGDPHFVPPRRDYVADVRQGIGRPIRSC